MNENKKKINENSVTFPNLNEESIQKELDSLELGFNYHVKVYKIDYKIFDSIIKKKI